VKLAFSIKDNSYRFFSSASVSSLIYFPISFFKSSNTAYNLTFSFSSASTYSSNLAL